MCKLYAPTQVSPHQADDASEQREVDPSWSDGEQEQERLPMEKSGVYVDPMATHVSRISPLA